MNDTRGTSRRVRRAVAIALSVLGLGVAAATIAGWLGSIWWLFDLCAHFVVQYAVAAALVALGLVAVGAPRRALGALALAAVNAWSFVPAWLASPEPPREGPTLSLVLTNVLSRNTDYAAVASWVREVTPDVVVALEVSPAWERELAVRLPEYRFGLTHARGDNFGLALRSKVPLTARVATFGGDLPSIIATIDVAGAPLEIIATHPVPPVGRDATTRRDAQLAAIAAHVARRGPGEVVVIGDLNATPWSAALDPLFDAGLADTRRGFGVHATWPAGNALLRIPIDHCLVSPGLVATRRAVGPDVGSDHLPIHVELGVRASDH